MLSNIGIGLSGNSRFHERWNNTVQYQTADFGGFQAGLQYMPDENKGNQGQGTNRNGYSYGVKWDSQMFYASVHQEVHNDHFGASSNITDATRTNTGNVNAHSRDMATRVSGEVRFAGQRVTLDVSRLHYTESGQAGTSGKFQDYKKPTWAVGYEGNIGPWGFATQYIRAGAGTCQLTGGTDCTTTGLQAWMWTLGARYRFDRQTFVYLIGSKLNNGASARMDNWAANDPNRGEDMRMFALGLSYSF